MAEILVGNIRGEKGDTGSGLKILDYYASIEELSSAVTNPSAGDAYGVGDGNPYDIYVYSPTHGWVNNGALQLDIGNIDDYRHQIVTGAYNGDSTVSRKISLDFTPDIVLVFSKSGMVSFLTDQNGYRGCGGMAFKGFPCQVGDTATIEIVDGGFCVSYIAPNGDATVHVPMSNELNAQYYYMAIRQPLK